MKTSLALFQEIEGETGERFVTRALGCLLRLDDVRNALLGCVPGLSPLNCNFEVEPEKRIIGGQPDIRMVGTGAVFLIENKFQAVLTKAQRDGYQEWFRVQSQQIKHLIFMVPSSRETDIRCELTQSLKELRDTAWSVIAWETVLIKLEGLEKSEATVLINEFIIEIRRRIKMNAPFHPNDIKVLAGKDVAEPYAKLIIFLNELKTALLGQDIVLNRSDGEGEEKGDYWGWDIDKFTEMGLELWVGLWVVLWKDHGKTPFWFSVRCPDQDREREVKRQFKDAMEYGDKSANYIVVPIILKQGESLSRQAEVVAQQITGFVQKLGEIIGRT